MHVPAQGGDWDNPKTFSSSDTGSVSALERFTLKVEALFA
jgi:hypothetical protein